MNPVTVRSDLREFLEPASIAIVGMSADATKHGGRVLANLHKLGYSGEVCGVNPKKPDVPGVEVFSSLSELPETPDLVVCAVPAPAVIEVAEEAASMGSRALVVFAGGFAESGEPGIESQAELLRLVKGSALRILGPNSGGVIRPSSGIAVSFLTCLDRYPAQIRSGSVGLVTQSGGTGSYIHNLAAARGGGLAASISTGNEVDVDLADGVHALSELDEVRSIAVVMETVRNGSAFIDAVQHAHALGKPVTVCRLGTSDRGKRLMRTHTGAMANPTAVLDGVLDSLAVTVTETPGELLDVAEVMARTPAPRGGRTAVVTHSGGVAILLTDLARRIGLDLPRPSEQVRKELECYLQLGVANNPVDMGAIIGGPQRFSQVVSTLAGSDEYDMVLAVSTAHPPAHSVPRVEQMLAETDPVPVVHLWMAGDQSFQGLNLLREAGRAVTEEPRAAIKALAGMARLSQADRMVFRSDNPAATKPELDEILATASTEHATKTILSELGFSVAEGALATTADEASVIADDLGGPVVLKVNSPDIPHKTEVGGVRVSVKGGVGARSAFLEVMSAVERARPDALIEGVRVERQHTGVDVIVGAVTDPVFGPMALLGFGGVAAEAIGGAAFAPLPLSLDSAQRLIDRVTGLRLTLQRHPGKDDAPDRLADLLDAVGDILLRSEISEIELNPVTWTGSEWVVLDALLS
ncbi:MAG: hypothetical protein GEU79_04920 [Acidimicrobiia bacterium]|nr:hypothetical protein [Acidimicrobiia bacterium]